MFSSDILNQSNQFNNGFSNLSGNENQPYSPTVNNGNDLNSTPTIGPGGSHFGQDFAFFSVLQGMNNTAQRQQMESINRTTQEHTSKLNDTIVQTQRNNSALQEEADDLMSINNRLRQQVASYEKLLTQPLNVIAQHNTTFSQNYREEKELLANWMVSQKAMRELAIQAGLALGLTKEDVSQLGLVSKINVLLNKNDPSIGNNATEKFFDLHRDTLIAKHLKKFPEASQIDSTKEELARRIKDAQELYSETKNQTEIKKTRSI